MLKVVGASWEQIRRSTLIIGVVIGLGIAAIIYTETNKPNEDGNFSATAYWDEEFGFDVKFWGQGKGLNDIPAGVAKAHFDPHILDKGWAILQVETQGGYRDAVQAHAAGLLEGALTWQVMHWHWLNTIKSYCDENELICGLIRNFLEGNRVWAEKMAKEHDAEEYWHQVNLFYIQLGAIEEGFRLAVDRIGRPDIEIPQVDFMWMNILSDFNDLAKKFTKSGKETDSSKMNLTFNCGYEDLPLSSAFVKLVSDQHDLFLAHNSAGPYNQMLKIFKRYDFQFHLTGGQYSELVPSTQMSFSSYPGSVHSMDDFYVLSNPSGHNLAVAATPLTIFNKTLYHFVNPTNQVFSGPRALTAARLSHSPSEWASIFSRHNSGTGNKQWLILDVQKFNKAADENRRSNSDSFPKLENLFWVLEQIPGQIEASDQTDTLLTQTYWASYGIPFFKKIYNDSGTLSMAEEHGPTFTYENTALANIFRRDQVSATSLEGVTRLMRSNMYKHDPFSEGNPRCAVGSRADVDEENTEAEGVTDVKILRTDLNSPVSSLRNSTARSQLEQARLQILAGPVYTDNATPASDDDVAPFSWKDGRFPNTPHNGQPDIWSFSPISISFV